MDTAEPASAQHWLIRLMGTEFPGTYLNFSISNSGYLRKKVALCLMSSDASKIPILPQRLSLIAQTVESLHDGIRAGHWQEFLPSERNLSTQLQVSRSTLRTALKDLERNGWLEVNQRQRRRILKKADRGEATKSSRQRVVRVIIESPLFQMSATTASVITVLRDTLNRAGVSMEIHEGRAYYCNRPARALKELVGKHPNSVWLLCYSKEQVERWFVRQGLPCLVIGSSRPDVPLPSIDADLRAVGRHAGGVLLRKGHRNIALVLPQDLFGGDADFEIGFREATAKISDSGEGFIRVLRHNETADHLCSLVNRVLRESNAPTAFLVARPIHSLTVLVHLLHIGKKIPQDIAVISRDDDNYLANINPAITRYTLKAGQFTKRLSLAARQLAETGLLPAEPIRLMPEFLPGETI